MPLPEAEVTENTMFRRSDICHFLLLTLTSLAPVLESFSHEHAHEGEHACAVVNGHFFYLETIQHDEMDGDDHLVGYRLGDAHEHSHCGLCLPHSTSFYGPETGLPYPAPPEPRVYAARLEPGRVFSPDRPLRGPPEPN